jgi:hypothetical protein
MAIRSQQNSHREPVPRASARTFVELLDRATDRPGKACLLIVITCAPIFAIAVCVSAVNAAHEMSSAEQFILWAATVSGGSALAFATSVGIRFIRKIRKTGARDAALPTSKPLPQASHEPTPRPPMRPPSRCTRQRSGRPRLPSGQPQLR